MSRGQRLGWLTGVVLAGLALAGIWLRFSRTGSKPAAGIENSENAKSAYVDSAVCAGCHQDVAKTYSQTGMARSLYPLKSGNLVEDFRTHNTVYAKASDRYYTMIQRDGKWYQRRHQIGFGGRETNVVEKQIDYVIGSGHHVRTYLSRTAEGKLIELPVSWYAEKGGYWAMSPGYDGPDQPDFRRAVVSQCMSCHNRYPAPDQISHLDQAEPVFGEKIGEGIDCQRCHGPGRAHAEAAASHALADAIRKAIVNPAKLGRDRQLEVCMQCHLQTTSRPLPGWLPKYDRAMFTWQPGQALSDSALFFDKAPGTGKDSFQIDHAAYRLRQSKCFLSSQMTCTTCHNPHNVPRAEEAVEHYNSVCQGCHASAHNANPASAEARGSCIECHMPQRRTDDVVHAVMTDHWIQRRKPARDLLDALRELREADFAAQDSYRGEVVPYYPAKLPDSPESALYFDVAQVHDGSNLTAGMAKLQHDLESYAPKRPEFYYELGKAEEKTGNRQQALHWYEEALKQSADYRPAQVEMASLLTGQGELPRAAQILEKAAAAPPPDSVVLVNLGGVYLKQGNLDRAAQMLYNALALDPDTPEGHNLLGLVLGQKGDWAGAEKELRDAIANQPDMSEAHYNLARLLAANGAYPEAQYHFEKAIAIKPSYADAHHQYGLLLVLMHAYDKAAAEYRDALRTQPNDAETQTDLGDILAAKGQIGEAADHYRQAIQSNPESHPAHLGLGLILARQGRMAEARGHLQKAAESPSPDVRDAALKALR